MKIVCATRNRGRRGTEKMALAYMRGLLAAGMDASLMLPEDGYLADNVRDSELRPHAFFLPNGWRWRLWGFPFFRARLKNILCDADVVVVHNALLEASLRRLTRAPIAAVNHLNKTRRMGRCDAVINLNSAMQKKMTAAGGDFEFAPERCLILSNGLSEIPPLPDRSGREGKIPVVGFAGALQSFKGCFDLLDAAKMINEPMRLIFAGEGGDQAEMELRAAHLKHQVEFRGHLTDLSEFYNECDIFCFPSHNESFGLALAEAMSHALPTVAANSDGIADIIRDGETGLLFSPGDAKTLAEKLRLLINDDAVSSPASLRRKIADSARRAILEKCAPEIFSRNLCKAMQTISALGRK